jgi:hypothetical protein
MCRIVYPTARMNVPCFLGRDTFNLDRHLERGFKDKPLETFVPYALR